MIRLVSQSTASMHKRTLPLFNRRIILSIFAVLALLYVLIGAGPAQAFTFFSSADGANSGSSAVNAGNYQDSASDMPSICSAVITVENGNDGGPGSLRQAILEACDNTTITFADNITVLLNYSELFIDKDITIDGAGHHVTISVGFGQVSPVGGMQVPGADVMGIPQELFMSLFSVSYDSAFHLKDVTITGGTMEVGGGIYTMEGSTSHVSGCTFIGNSAAVGGAIYNSGTMTVTNCTFTGNSAVNGGGAIANNGGTLAVTNCTLSGNSTGPDGGVIYNLDGTLTINNTIVSDSTGSSCGGVLTGSGNLTDNDTCGDVFSNSALILLGSLGDNGGWTHTFPLLPGSEALDAAEGDSCPATDQRGIMRPQGSACDIGAFELEVIPPDNDTFTLQVIPPVFRKILVPSLPDRVQASRIIGVCDRPEDCGDGDIDKGLGAAGAIAMLRLLGLTVPLQTCMLVAEQDAVCDTGAMPAWNSDSIRTVFKLRLTRRVILALVFVNPFTAQAGTYTVTMGDCEGTVVLENL